MVRFISIIFESLPLIFRTIEQSKANTTLRCDHKSFQVRFKKLEKENLRMKLWYAKVNMQFKEMLRSD